MILFHGSQKHNLKQLSIGTADKQGLGIYLTDSMEQAEGYAKDGGQVYIVELEIDKLLDFSNIDLMFTIFSEVIHIDFIKTEIECLVVGSGVLSNILNYLKFEQRQNLEKKLDEYKIYKIPSLGFRGHFNYIVKDMSLVTIIK